LFKSYLKNAREFRKINNRPFITLSYAQSLDGSITTKRGESLLISGKETLSIVHELRSLHMGILVGIDTVLTDNPRLTNRIGNGKNPKPIILDTNLRIPLKSNLLLGEVKPWIYSKTNLGNTKIKIIENMGGKVIDIFLTPDGKLDLFQVVKDLTTKNIDSLMIEGGAKVIQSFLDCQLVDLMVVTIAPSIVGGVKAFEKLISEKREIEKFPQIINPIVNKVGKDFILYGLVKY